MSRGLSARADPCNTAGIQHNVIKTSYAFAQYTAVLQIMFSNIQSDIGLAVILPLIDKQFHHRSQPSNRFPLSEASP